MLSFCDNTAVACQLSWASFRLASEAQPVGWDRRGGLLSRVTIFHPTSDGPDLDYKCLALSTVEIWKILWNLT